MTRILFLVAALLIAGFAGCAGSDDTDAAIEPIDSIIVGEIAVTPDLTGTTATLDVDTSIPVACAVIYGTDETFGFVAVDNDMQGGAHEDHGPLLRGLNPDTEYQYILQGSDASGTIYRSEVMTFRTPAAVETGFGANVATDATINAASSSFSDDFAAELAIDGDLETEWSTDGDGDDAWIEIGLGDEVEVSGVAFITRQMSDGSAITNTYSVTINDTLVGPFDAGPHVQPLVEPIVGSTIRFDAERTTGGNTGAVEIEVYTGNAG